MNGPQEEQLVFSFSKEIKETFFHRIPHAQWKIERVTEHYWLFGVHDTHIETYPYLYSLHFDWKNRLFTLRLEQEIMKSTYLFPHVYYRFLHFLKERQIDVLIRNDNYGVKHALYKRKQVPLHATGEGSQQVVHLLEMVNEQVKSGAFYFWKEQQSIYFSTPLIPNLFYSVQLFINEKERPTQGMIEIKGQLLKHAREIEQSFQDVKHQLELLQRKEREMIDYLAHLHKKSYYDPFSESLYLFEKTIPFSIKLLIGEEKATPYHYIVRFGSETKQSSSLTSLIEEVKKDMYDYVIQDRLRAVVEGRI